MKLAALALSLLFLLPGAQAILLFCEEAGTNCQDLTPRTFRVVLAVVVEDDITIFHCTGNGDSAGAIANGARRGEPPSVAAERSPEDCADGTYVRIPGALWFPDLTIRPQSTQSRSTAPDPSEIASASDGACATCEAGSLRISAELEVELDPREKDAALHGSVSWAFEPQRPARAGADLPDQGADVPVAFRLSRALALSLAPPGFDPGDAPGPVLEALAAALAALPPVPGATLPETTVPAASAPPLPASAHPGLPDAPRSDAPSVDAPSRELANPSRADVAGAATNEGGEHATGRASVDAAGVDSPEFGFEVEPFGEALPFEDPRAAPLPEAFVEGQATDAIDRPTSLVRRAPSNGGSEPSLRAAPDARPSDSPRSSVAEGVALPRSESPSTLPLALLAFSALVAAAVALYSRLSRHALLANATRQRILEALGERPGALASDLASRLGFALPTALYQLRLLQKAGLVRSLEVEGRARWFLASDPRVAEVASAIADATPRSRLLAAIEARPGLSLLEAAQSSGVNYKSAHRHVKAMREEGRVVLVREPTCVRVFAASGSRS